MIRSALFAAALALAACTPAQEAKEEAAPVANNSRSQADLSEIRTDGSVLA